MPQPRPMPDAGRLREHLGYDASSPSGLVWRKARGRVPAGRFAGRRHQSGYWSIRFDGRELYAHRVIWLLSTGEDPGALQVDHINGDPGDNRLSNLRLATIRSNQHNRRSQSASTSIFKGVCRPADYRRWLAHIRDEGGNRKLGLFRCETAAALAYDREARRLHGKFARLNFAV